MASLRINISIQESTLNEMDNLAKELKISRSALIENLMKNAYMPKVVETAKGYEKSYRGATSHNVQSDIKSCVRNLYLELGYIFRDNKIAKNYFINEIIRKIKNLTMDKAVNSWAFISYPDSSLFEEIKED